MKKHIIHILLSGILLTGISCSSTPESFVTHTPQPPVKVNTARVKLASQDNVYTSSGKIQADKHTNISTRIMGYVEHIHVNTGDRVKQGQILITLNNKDLNAKLAQVNAGISEAQAAFTNAEKDYNRFLELYKTESASLKELDDITAHYNMAKARLEGAKQMKEEVHAQLEYTNIKAPFSGTIASEFINQGDLANPGMPLLSLENNTSFEVITMVSETEVTQLKIGTPVNVVLKSDQRKFEGIIKEISSSTLHSGSQYQVNIQLNHPTDLYSGMYAQVQFPISNTSINTTILLPTSALVHHGQLQGVYIVSQQNTAVLRWLRLGDQIGNQVEVLSGLNPGDTYILSAQGKLESGSLLTVLN